MTCLLIDLGNSDDVKDNYYKLLKLMNNFYIEKLYFQLIFDFFFFIRSLRKVTWAIAALTLICTEENKTYRG